MNDPDLYVRCSALSCLATNQVVEAIPIMADMLRRGEQVSLHDSFEAYKTKDAIPFLNPLIVDPASEYLRYWTITAMSANKLADKSSIPFLMEALKVEGVPEHRGNISNSAYRLLHLVIPELGPPKRSIDFKANRAAEIKILEDWWAENGTGSAI